MLEKTGFMLRSVYAKYLLGVLNSSFFLYVYKSLYSSVELGSKGYQFNKHALEKYPVPHIIDSERMMFEKIVDLIIDKRGNLYGTQDLESQIDLMVYKLYELEYLEAKLIDPDLDSVLATFGLSAQDFERMSIEDLSKLEVK